MSSTEKSVTSVPSVPSVPAIFHWSTGAIVGVTIGVLIAVFYIYVCFISVKKAIEDRHKIIARNKARRKAKEFKQTYSKPPNLFNDSKPLTDNMPMEVTHNKNHDRKSAHNGDVDLLHDTYTPGVLPVAIGDVEGTARSEAHGGGGGGGGAGGGAGGLGRSRRPESSNASTNASFKGSRQGSTRRRHSYERAVDKLTVEAGATPKVNDGRKSTAKESLKETTPRLGHLADLNQFNNHQPITAANKKAPNTTAVVTAAPHNSAVKEASV